MILPQAFEKRMQALLGQDYDAFYQALQSDAVKGLRVNTNKISVESFTENAPFPLKPIPYVKGGFIVSEEVQAGKHPYHQAGVYYLQDPGAMAPVAALPQEIWKQSGLRVLDLCAAPGGKTTQLAASCAELDGVVLANEYNAARSRILAANVERMGLTNVCVTNADSEGIADQYDSFFDIVVVDAPCSGEGMFRKADIAISEWSEENVAMCAARQSEILENAARCVTSGGYLLYSTCTYATEENEQVVASFLCAHSDFSLIPCDPAVVAHTANGIVGWDARGNDLALCRRFYPHVSSGEGQFLALMCRDGERTGHPSKERETQVSLPKALRETAQAFLRETLERAVEPLLLRHGYICTLPALLNNEMPIPAHTVALGTPIGEERKGRIVPHHHFFMSFGAACRSQLILDLEDGRLAKYLAGEEIDIPTDYKGYTAVLIRCGNEMVSIGGGKAGGGKLKNYYPKGLRIHY